MTVIDSNEGYISTPWGFMKQMGYKDRTWCGQPNCKNECGRQFTAEDRSKAIYWWGGNDFPIMMAELCDEEGKLKP